MRPHLSWAWCWLAVLATAAWAGEETRFQGETGIPAPLSRATTWSWGVRGTAIDISVPHGWGKVATRPPPTEVVSTKQGTTYRIETHGTPLEELYVAVASRE